MICKPGKSYDIDGIREMRTETCPREVGVQRIRGRFATVNMYPWKLHSFARAGSQPLLASQYRQSTRCCLSGETADTYGVHPSAHIRDVETPWAESD